MKAFDLISPDYAAQQRELHSRPQGYGGKGSKWADTVAVIAGRLKASSILDYGCGQGSLARTLRDKYGDIIRVDEYDPAIKGKTALPLFADLVVCTDVLEHIEPERLDSVLAHLRMLAKKAVFVVIATREANKTLADGRNAHLIVENDEWWTTRLEASGFQIEVSGYAPLSRKPSREFAAVLIP